MKIRNGTTIIALLKKILWVSLTAIALAGLLFNVKRKLVLTQVRDLGGPTSKQIPKLKKPQILTIN